MCSSVKRIVKRTLVQKENINIIQTHYIEVLETEHVMYKIEF